MDDRADTGSELSKKSKRSHARLIQLLEARHAAGREHPTRWRERLGAATQSRPPGPLIWIHAANEAAARAHLHLIEWMRLERDELIFLITTAAFSPDNTLPDHLPDQCFHQYLPIEEEPALGQFLEHWRPDVCIWADTELREIVIDAVAQKNVALFMINAAFSDEDQHRLRWFPAAARNAFNRFESILAMDGRSAGNMKRLGVDLDRIEVLGRMNETAPPLDYIHALREDLAARLAARPVWLAAGIDPVEEAAIVNAHRKVSRQSHRLLLVLVPDDKPCGAEIAARLEREGWNVALRSQGQQPEPDTQIYVADINREMGLWFRLAPVTFLGCTLVPNGGHARDPYQAAVLGSAILHGPEQGIFGHNYRRLHAAGAAREVQNEAALADELELLLAPDRVAEMARAAWEVSTRGAEATDRLCELVLANLDRRGI